VKGRIAKPKKNTIESRTSRSHEQALTPNISNGTFE
jgi:hypothetical protein